MSRLTGILLVMMGLLLGGCAPIAYKMVCTNAWTEDDKCGGKPYQAPQQPQNLQGSHGQYIPLGGNQYLNNGTGQIEQRYGNQMFNNAGQGNNIINNRVYEQPNQQPLLPPLLGNPCCGQGGR